MANDALVPLRVEPPRIGGSGGYFIFGVLCLALGGLFSFGGGLVGIGAASFFTSLGGLLVAVGFWVNLFGKIEARLIDIQEHLREQ